MCIIFFLLNCKKRLTGFLSEVHGLSGFHLMHLNSTFLKSSQFRLIPIMTSSKSEAKNVFGLDTFPSGLLDGERLNRIQVIYVNLFVFTWKLNISKNPGFWKLKAYLNGKNKYFSTECLNCSNFNNAIR